MTSSMLRHLLITSDRLQYWALLLIVLPALQKGHWTYDCKASASVYQSRPSRTKQLMDPNVRPQLAMSDLFYKQALSMPQ